VPDIEADFVTDLTNGERPGDPVVTRRLVKRLNALAGEGHARVACDIEEVG
jgi:hypothetical protein